MSVLDLSRIARVLILLTLQAPAGAAPSLPVAGGAPLGAATGGPRLVDRTLESQIRFTHDAVRSAAHQLPETMGAGLALLDFDLDGDLDAFFVQGGPAGPDAALTSRGNELWRNDGLAHFEKVPGAAGAAEPGLGMGACVGDVDSDGDPDIVETRVGSLVLLRNRGDGSFAKAQDSGLASTAWGCSCTFADVDGDADLDLYVTNYLDWDPVKKNPWCGDVRRGERAYCHPDVFSGQRDTLWVNDGKGRFTDGTLAAGLAGATGNGLGVVATDIDQDGDVDFYVANDASPNFLWLGDGHGRFADRGVLAGVAHDENGKSLSGMGVLTGDWNGDGLGDLFVTNLDIETNTLYRQGPRPGTFRVVTAESGLSDEGPVGFGTESLDFDLDGDLDLYVANGHVIDNIAVFNPSLTHAQPDQLFVNNGRGRFELAGRERGDVGMRRLVARGCAAGDLNGDGAPDLVVTTNNGPALVYLAESTRPRPHLTLQLKGTRSHPDAYNARVELRKAAKGAASGPVLARAEVQAARSYLSQGTKLVHMACPVPSADVSVAWPSGLVESWNGMRPGAWLLVEGASRTPPAKLGPQR